jgi:hypothetical protein
VKLFIIFVLFYSNIYSNFNIHDNETFALDTNEHFIVTSLIIDDTSTFDANTDTNISIENDFKNGGTFNASTSTITFTGTQESFISGNTTFYDLIARKDLLFQANSTQVFLNGLLLKGDATSSFIHSDEIGVQAVFDLSNHPTTDISYVEVQDIKNIGLATAINPPNSVNISNTTLWFSEKVDLNCTSIDANITGFKQLSCMKDGIKEIRYVSVPTPTEQQTTKLVIKSGIKLDIDRKKDITTITYDPEPEIKTCENNKRAIINLINDGSISTGFVNKSGCDVYEDPTVENFETIKDDTTVYFEKTTTQDEKLHEGAKSVIVMDINLTIPITIGEINGIK